VICALNSPSRPQGAVYPIAFPPREPSVQTVIAAGRVAGWRAWTARGMKLGNLRWQVHRLENLLGNGLRLDERDETELAVAFLADDLEPKCLSQQLCPWNVFRRTGRLVLPGGCGQWLGGGRHDGTATGGVGRENPEIASEMSLRRRDERSQSSDQRERRKLDGARAIGPGLLEFQSPGIGGLFSLGDRGIG